MALPVQVQVQAKAPPDAGLPLELLIEGLEQGRSCQERRSAVLALMARRDPRALPALQAARKRAVGKGARNGCMLQDLDMAIDLSKPR